MCFSPLDTRRGTLGSLTFRGSPSEFPGHGHVRKRVVTSADEWSEKLHAFGRLVPGAVGEETPTGTMSSTALGSLLTYRLSGTPQVMRRSARAARQEPDLVKVCLPLVGSGVVWQENCQVRLVPGEMVLYEAARAFDALVDQPWTVVVLAFQRDAISLPQRFLQRSLRRPFALDGGPGAVLAGFVYSMIRHGPAMGAGAGRIGEAGLHLIASTLGETGMPDDDVAADAQRIRVLQYARMYLTDPDLTHDRVAVALNMAPRTLHRLFEDEPYTVTEYIRVRRLEAAHLELSDPLLRHRSIASVAARWGFRNQAHFTRAFQAQYGITPSTARRGDLRHQSQN